MDEAAAEEASTSTALHANRSEAVESTLQLPMNVEWLIFVLISLVGIVFNIGIFWRRKFSARKTSSTTHISLSLLCTMAAADTVCLFALLFLLTLRYWGISNFAFYSLVCKLDVFVIHAASAFSIWCWLVLSAVRYVAIYRPYTHLKMHKEPHLAIIGVAVFCCLSESWLLFDITYVPQLKGCESSSDEVTSRRFQIFEIIVSYFLPLIIITILDLKVVVLFCRTVWWSNLGSTRQFTPIPNIDSAEQEARAKRRAQQLKVLRRCLVITIFDLGMNLPNYGYRLYLCLLSKEEMMNSNQNVQETIELITQFALNALYLVCIIYGSPKKKRVPVSSRKTQDTDLDVKY